MITIYTERLIPERFGAVNFGPITLIRPKYKDDAGLHAHEAVHAAQWWMWAAAGMFVAAVTYLSNVPVYYGAWWAPAVAGVLVHPLAYKLWAKYRLDCEVNAYKEQLTHYPDDRTELFGGYLASKYGLDIGHTAAIRLLRE